jgi:hypothetical protein
LEDLRTLDKERLLSCWQAFRPCVVREGVCEAILRMSPEAAALRLIASLRAQATAQAERGEVDVSVGETLSTSISPDVAHSVRKDPMYVFFGHVSDRKYVNMPLGAFLDIFEQQIASCCGDGGVDGVLGRGIYLAQFPLYTAPTPWELAQAAGGFPGTTRGGTSRTTSTDDAYDWLRGPNISELLGNRSLCHVNCWINLNSSRSSLHFDSYHNLIVVLRGRKHLRLLPPSAALKDASQYASSGPPLRAEPAASASANHANYRLLDDALAAGAVAAAEVAEVSLGPGQCLLLPEGYWHEVTSEPCTMALVRVSSDMFNVVTHYFFVILFRQNYWFLSPLGQLLQCAPGPAALPALAMRHGLRCLLEEQAARRGEERPPPPRARMRRGAFRTIMLLCARRPNRRQQQVSSSGWLVGAAGRVAGAWRERFSRMDLHDMRRLWVPFATQVTYMHAHHCCRNHLLFERTSSVCFMRQEPAVWGHWLLSLSARQACRVVRTWEQGEGWQWGAPDGGGDRHDYNHDNDASNAVAEDGASEMGIDTRGHKR